MSKQNKPSFFGRLFRQSKATKETIDGNERRRDRNEVTFSETRYYDNRNRPTQAFVVDEEDLRDENGLYKATAAYHTNKRVKPSRGARSCHGKLIDARVLGDSSDSENPHNRSFQSTFNATDLGKRNFRRSSKRHKKAPRPVLEEYDEQSSSNTSSNILKTLDMNVHHKPQMMIPNISEYYKHPSRFYEESRTMLLERKLLESNQKIKECINKYRREKARASDLQAQVNAMNNRSRFDVQMIHEQQKQIQKLQEEIERLRNNSFMPPPPAFASAVPFQSHFQQRHSATPSSYIFSNYHNPITPNMNDLNAMAPTRTVSEVDNEDSSFLIKDFRADEGVREQLVSGSSLPISLHEETEIPRSLKEEDSVVTLTSNLAVHSDIVPVVTRDEGYSTSETGCKFNRNLNRRSRHFGTSVPKKIRRTNSCN